MAKNNAAIYDISTYLAAGIDPKTKLPIRSGVCGYKEAIKKNLRIIDEQDAVNRYVWYNLPANITSQELERMLYYKGQLAFFFSKADKKFYFMPYALNGGLDFYGRFTSIHPIPLAEGVTDEEKRATARLRNYLSTLRLDCIYEVEAEDLANPDLLTDSAVLIHDYTKQLSQTIIPRQQLQDGIIDIMSDCIPFMRTALLNSTGVLGMRVGNDDEANEVYRLSDFINKAALTGSKYIPIEGQMEFQELTGADVAKSEEFLLAMQALDNFRLSTYGIENGGLFEKKAHTLESEQAMNTGNTGIVYNDGLKIRQHFCDVVNSIWGDTILGGKYLWCLPSEQAMGVDTSGDGIVMDEQDQSGSVGGEQPEMPAEEA